jgi:invasion protein IalB
MTLRDMALRTRIRFIVKIRLSTVALALSALLAASPMVHAQEDAGAAKGDQQAPEGEATQFGPRAGANGQQPEGPKTETVATHGKWAVQCTELPKEQGGKSCGMIQNTKSDKDERVAISIIVSKVTQQGKTVTFMRILAPIGVYLPTGIPVEIDGAALPNRLPFSRCLPRMCEGFGEASPETLTKFKKGTTATFYLYDRPGNGYPMNISLEGFGAALAELGKL